MATDTVAKVTKILSIVEPCLVRLISYAYYC